MAVTNPVAPAGSTLEGKISKVVVGASLAAAALGAIATAAIPFIEPITKAAQEKSWAALALSVSGLASAAWAAGKLAISRGTVKAAMIATNTPPMGDPALLSPSVDATSTK